MLFSNIIQIKFLLLLNNAFGPFVMDIFYLKGLYSSMNNFKNIEFKIILKYECSTMNE